MKVLGIACSPRRKGNSEILLDTALRGAQDRGAETQKIILAELNIRPCQGCEACRYGKCIQQDDMEKLYPLLKESDALILASPIYFYGLPAHAKAMIDRCQVFWYRQDELGNRDKREIVTRRGVFIAVGATRGAKLFEGAVLTTKYFFKVLRINYWGDLLVREIENYKEVLGKPDILKAAYSLGEQLAGGLTSLG